MNADGTGLPVDSLEILRRRRSAKWRTYDAGVLPLTVAEMDFALAEPVAEVLRRAVAASDTGYAHAPLGPDKRAEFPQIGMHPRSHDDLWTLEYQAVEGAHPGTGPDYFNDHGKCTARVTGPSQ